MHDACQTYRMAVWAYCLMPNHVHHVLVPQDEKSLSLVVQVAHGDYATYLNKKYSLVGHAWQGRFKSTAMDSGHCFNAIRYVERNPLKAGMVHRAEEYRWSSAAAHCGLRPDPLLMGDCPYVHEISCWSDWLNSPAIEKEEDMIRLHTRTGKPLGSEVFLRQLESLTGRTLASGKRGRPPKQAKN
jgi:putative transposase